MAVKSVSLFAAIIIAYLSFTTQAFPLRYLQDVGFGFPFPYQINTASSTNFINNINNINSFLPYPAVQNVPGLGYPNGQPSIFANGPPIGYPNQIVNSQSAPVEVNFIPNPGCYSGC
ncbi:uncharacterized protein LOC123302416 [Chrysoperla carnea]|uniref:uncharacterized protein LOC123302416 n=1 Tax=Chrysoperla carnea TaxID=189513 RepID=UPI001D06AF0A|nr:uncharacterized protein LOC123302416 [Chrysoperla carnea]